MIPGVVYGNTNRLVAMNRTKAIQFIKSLRGVKKVFALEVESNGESESKRVVIQDYQLSKVKKQLLHVDFFEVGEHTVLTAEIPIRIMNDENCPAVKEGGVIHVIRRTVPVSCSAANVPECILVDVKDLQFSENIHVLDLEYPEGVKPIVKDRNFTLITVAGRMAEEIEDMEAAEEIAEEGQAAEGEESDDRPDSA